MQQLQARLLHTVETMPPSLETQLLHVKYVKMLYPVASCNMATHCQRQRRVCLKVAQTLELGLTS